MATNAFFDPDEQAIQSQLKYAQALRQRGMDTDGQMVSGIYVPKNPLSTLLESGFGSALEQQQQNALRQLSNQRNQEYADFMARRPDIMTDAPMVQQHGPLMPGQEQLPDVPSSPNRVLKSSMQMLEDQNKWLGSIGNTTNPLLRTLQQQSVMSDFGWPEKLMERERADAARKDLNDERLRQARELATEKNAILEEKIKRDREAAAEKARVDAEKEETRNLFRSMGLNIQQQQADTRKAAERREQEKADEKKSEAAIKRQTEESAYSSGLDHLETMVKELYDPTLPKGHEKKEHPGLSPSLGMIQGGAASNRYLPVTLSPFDRNDAITKIEGLQEYLQSKGLEDLKKAGVSPGSVTEKEWSKFAIRLANLSRNQSESSFKAELEKILKEVGDQRARLNAGQIVPREPSTGAGAGTAPTIVKKVPLNNGRTGVLWSNGERTVE